MCSSISLPMESSSFHWRVEGKRESARIGGSAHDPDPVIGELEVAAREVYFGHMASGAVFLTNLTRLSRWRVMTPLAICVIVGGTFHNVLMGIVAPHATDAFVPDG